MEHPNLIKEQKENMKPAIRSLRNLCFQTVLLMIISFLTGFNVGHGLNALFQWGVLIGLSIVFIISVRVHYKAISEIPFSGIY